MPLWGEIYLLKFKGFGSLIQDGQLETVPGMRMHFLDPKLLPPRLSTSLKRWNSNKSIDQLDCSLSSTNELR